jgi:hypothetical protein
MKASDKRHRQEWGALARQLLHSSSRHAACPECGKPALTVQDLEYGGGAARGLVRYLSCANCSGFDFVTLRRAGTSPTGRFGQVHLDGIMADATGEMLVRQGSAA